MSSRPILSGIPTVEVNQDRYDELVRKEERLRILEDFVGKDFFKNVKNKVLVNDDLVLVEDVKCETDLQNCT